MRPHAVVLAGAIATSSFGCVSTARRVPNVASSPADALAPSADGVSIHYVVEGTGPAVVLAHCLGCNLHYWDVVAADLRRDHRVVRLDLAGHGGSGADRKAWSIDSFVADVRAVVNAAGVERFTLVGHSMSGTIALETARQLGDRVVGVVPVDSVLDVDAHVPAETLAALSAKIRDDYAGFIDAQLPRLLPANPDPQVVARVRRDAMASDPIRTAAILESVLGYREDLALDGLAMPIVAIDSDLRPVALEHNRAHAPQFEARVIHGAGHFVMLDKPSEFGAALREVVESIEAGKATPRMRAVALRALLGGRQASRSPQRACAGPARL